jgi:hypothetical protein
MVVKEMAKAVEWVTAREISVWRVALGLGRGSTLRVRSA